MKRVMTVLLSMALGWSVIAAQAQQGAATAAPAKNPRKKMISRQSGPTISAQLSELKQAIEAQQQQIRQLGDQVQSRDQQIQQMQQTLQQSQTAAAQAQSKADAASSQAADQAQVVSSLKGDVVDLKGNAANSALALQETQKTVHAMSSPAAIQFKGITITPGGFIAAETVYRQRATSGDINTPFTGIPFQGNALSRVSETNFSGRQSRLSVLGESTIGGAKLTGYWEADFLGTGVTSNNRQSNSYVFRQRNLWGQVGLKNGWTFSGGQMWSILVEDKKGIQLRQEALPMTIDAQYNVGFSWARQYGFRAVKDFGGKLAVGVSVEGPQATIGGRGFSLVTTVNQGTAATTTTGNTFINAPGAGGGLFNFVDTTGYSVNKAPDFLFKAAFDPGWGHYEVFGIVSQFRNRVYPCGVVGTNATDTVVPVTPTTIACPINGSTTPSAVGAFDDTLAGGGVGLNFRLPVVAKKLDFAFQGMAGDGVGRYGSAQIADLTFRPDGTAALIRTGHGLAGIEGHTAKMDLYAYYGAEYGARASYVGYNSIAITKTPAIPATATTLAIPSTTTTTIKTGQIGGYGSPFANNSGCNTENPPSNQLTPSAGGTCAGDIRVIMEGTLGFWYKLYQGNKGGFRFGLQYSYFSKNGWSGNNNVLGAPGISPKAVDNMVFTSLRYYIP
jgi:biotin operon repressor